jgi:hypothetical protein
MPTLEEQVHLLNSELQNLARKNAQWLEYFFSQSEGFLQVIGESPINCCGGERMAVPPALMPKSAAEKFARGQRAFRAALDVVFYGHLEGSWHRLAEALRLEEATFRYVERSRRPRLLTIARPDIVIHGDQVTMVEPNAGSCVGFMPDADILGRLFEASPVIGAFLRDHGARRADIVAALARYLRSRLTATGNDPAEALIVVTEFRDEFGQACDDCPGIARELRRYDLRTEAVAVEDLDVKDSGIWLEGERCALIYRVAGEEPDPTAHYPVLEPILKAGRDGRVVLVDDLDDAIAVNKTILATMSEDLDAGRIPGDLAAELKTFIPWSRVLEETYIEIDGERVDLPSWCLTNREVLVLKPGAGFGGRGVTIGCETDPGPWAAAIADALASPEAWLVQRLARSHVTTTSILQCGSLVTEENYVDYGSFAITGAAAETIVRKVAPFGNVTRKVKYGSAGPVFII